MSNQNKHEEVVERLITGLGLVALAVVFFVSASDLNPLILWAVQ